MDIWFLLAIITLLFGVPLWIVARKKNPGPEPVWVDVNRNDFEAGRSGDYNYRSAQEQATHDFRSASLRWEEDRKIASGGKVISRILLGLGVFLFVMSLWVQVPTNTIGIYTSFGKPVDARPNGFQDKLPWEKVSKDFDASRQYMKFDGKGNDKEADEDGKVFPCLPVKMDREAKACLTVTVGWQMKAGTKSEREQAKELFRAHKTFARLTENFMKANIQDAAQASYSDVNPLVIGQNPGFSTLSDETETNLRKLVGGDVAVLSVQITGADYDPATDDSIAKMQAEYAKTEQARQLEQTNAAISKANKALVEQGKLTPEVLQAECIKVAKEVGSNPGVCLQPGWGSFGSPAQAATK